MTRLPDPGGDDGTWGDILNAYLEVSLNNDGTLKPVAASSLDGNVQTSLGKADSAVQSVNGKTGTSVSLSASDVGALPTSTKLSGLADTSGAAGASNNQVLAFNGGTNQWIASTVSSTPVNDATTSSKGIVQLAGDLAGTAASPSVAKINGITLPGSAPGSGQVLTASSTSAASWITPEAINVKDYGAVGNGSTDDAAAIQAADTAAAALGRPVVLFFPAGTYIFGTTLKISVPWQGLPRQSILQQASSFTYTGFASQFSIMNKHFSTTYNSSTADDVSVTGLDLVVQPGSSSGKGAFGLANVSGGEIRDCHFTTTGSNPAGSLIDLYACVRLFAVSQVSAINGTQGATGGCMWIRNLTSDGSVSTNVTENIIVKDSYFGHTAGDEAIAVFGTFGLVRRVRVQNSVVEALASSQNHNYLVSTFPLSSTAYAAVDDIQWIGCTFIDTHGTLTSRLFKFGDVSDTSNKCQNLRAINCSFYAQTATASNNYSICYNTADTFDGGSSGNALINCYVDASGSGQPFQQGIIGFDKVVAPTVVGNINIGVRGSTNVIGGSIEAATQGCYNCPNVENVRITLSTTTGSAYYMDNSNATLASFKDCIISGGQALLTATSGVTTGVYVEVTNNLMNTTATSGNVISVPSSSAPRVRLIGNTVFGNTTLGFSGTIAYSEANDWYGVVDRPFHRVTAITQSATPAIDTDNTDVAIIAGLAQDITSMTTSLTGTPRDTDFLIIRITDNGSPRAISWGSSFVSSTVALPSTTVVSTMLTVGLTWNAAAGKWLCLAVA